MNLIHLETRITTGLDMSTKRSALVIEDDAHSLLAISEMLREMNIAFKRNTNGAEVIQRVKRMRTPPDFIVLNLDLPDGDAYSICRQLRRQKHLRDVPVIATADQYSESLLDCLRHQGFSGFVQKPIARRYFGDFLDDVLQGDTSFTTLMSSPGSSSLSTV
ncbi:MAG: response regulator [Phototrophicaceae bacterium]